MLRINREPTPELSSQFLEQARALAELLGPHITEATLIAWHSMFLPLNDNPLEATDPADILREARNITAFIMNTVLNLPSDNSPRGIPPLIIWRVFEGSNQVGKDTAAEEMRKKKEPPLPFQDPDKELKEPPPIPIAKVLTQLRLGKCPEYLRERCEQVTIRQLLKGQKTLSLNPNEKDQGNILSDPSLQLFNFILRRLAFTQQLRDVSAASRNSSNEVIETVIVRNFMSSMVYQALGLAYSAWLQHTFKDKTPNLSMLTPEQIQAFENYLIYYQELIAHIHILLMLKGLVYTPQQITVFYAADHLPEAIMPQKPEDNSSSTPIIYMRAGDLFGNYQEKTSQEQRTFWLQGLIYKAQDLVTADNRQNELTVSNPHGHQDEDAIDAIEAAMQTPINGEKTLWPENMLYLYAVRALRKALEYYPGLSMELQEVLARRLSDEEISELIEGDPTKLPEVLGQAFLECCSE